MALCSERPFPALHGAVRSPGRCEILVHASLQRRNSSLRRRPPYFCPVLLLVQMGGEYLGARYASPKKEIRHLHHDITSGGCSDPSHPKTDTLAHYGLISAILRLFLPDPPGAPIPKNEFLVTFSDHIARSLLVATEDCRSAR
jgi:hypothetical protein